MNEFELTSATMGEICREIKRAFERKEVTRLMGKYITDNKTAMELDNAQFDLGVDAAPTDLFGDANVVRRVYSENEKLPECWTLPSEDITDYAKLDRAEAMHAFSDYAVEAYDAGDYYIAHCAAKRALDAAIEMGNSMIARWMAGISANCNNKGLHELRIIFGEVA